MENFAIMIPEHAMYQIKGVWITGGTGKEYNDFEKWFEKQKYHQLSLGSFKVDMWMRYSDLIIDKTGYSIQDLFNRWKKDPPGPDGFQFTTTTIKIK